MKFHFNLGGRDPYGHRHYGRRRVRLSELRPGIYISFGPLGNAIMSGMLVAVGGFLTLLGLLGNILVLIMGVLFIIFWVIACRSNIRAFKSERRARRAERNTKINNDENSDE